MLINKKCSICGTTSTLLLLHWSCAGIICYINMSMDAQTFFLPSLFVFYDIKCDLRSTVLASFSVYMVVVNSKHPMLSRPPHSSYEPLWPFFNPPSYPSSLNPGSHQSTLCLHEFLLLNSTYKGEAVLLVLLRLACFIYRSSSFQCFILSNFYLFKKGTIFCWRWYTSHFPIHPQRSLPIASIFWLLWLILQRMLESSCPTEISFP